MSIKKYGKGMGSGWHFESARHSLASRGIKSGRQSSYRMLRKGDELLMQKTDYPSHKKSVRRVAYAKNDDYWGDEWKEGSHIHVSDGDWSIGNGTIVGFQDDKKLWAIVKLDDPNADTKGYGISGRKGYVSAYKGYSYRFTKPDVGEAIKLGEMRFNDIYNFGMISQTTAPAKIKSHITFNYPQENKINVREKSVYPFAKFRDLFKKSNVIKIYNRNGDLVRELTKKGNKVYIDAQVGKGIDIAEMDIDDQLYYEPWTMDYGSIVFVSNGSVPATKGRLLKLATEDDKLVFEVD